MSPRPGTTTEHAQELLADPIVSQWLKAAIRAALDRDPLDALNDAEELHELMTKRVKEIGL